MLNKLKNMSKREIWLGVYHTFLVILGSVILGFGTGIFLTENTIVAGGLSGIAFIIQHFLPDTTQIVDIVVWIATAILWFISLFVIGKKFAMQTLLASIVFPLALSLFYRLEVFQDIAKLVAHSEIIVSSDPLVTVTQTTTGDLLLCAIFGGLLNGIGVSLTFLGKGSTGGVDVIAFILNKYTGMKVSNASLMIDVSIIIVGIFALSFPTMLVNCLVGIVAAIMTMIMIEIIYTRRENAFVLDIVSSKWEEITDHIINDMERGVSLIDIEGAYTSTPRKMIRTVLSKNEYVQIKDYLGKVDPTAFCTFTDTNAVFGEGFKENFNRNHKSILNKITGKNKDDKKEK